MKKKDFKLIYGALGPINNVIKSQVVNLLELIDKNGINFDLIIFNGIRNRIKENSQYKKDIPVIKNKLNNRITIFYFPYLNKKIGKLYVKLVLFLIIIYEGFFYKRIIVHTRTATFANIISELMQHFKKDIKLIFDHRGDVVAEKQYFFEKNGQSVKTAKAEKQINNLKNDVHRALKKSDYIFCISNELKRLTIKNFGIEEDKIDVVPCCADERYFYFNEKKRRERRKELGIEDKFVLVYCGSMKAEWCIPDKIALFAEGILKTNERLFLLVLTPDEKEAKFWLTNLLLQKRTIILSVDHYQVGEYLMAADMGLLLREPHLLNKVASPTKFAEYIMCGLPVIISKGIGDFAALVRENKIGIVLDNIDDVQSIGDKIIKYIERQYQESKRISKLGTHLFAKQSNVDKYISKYTELSRLN